MEKDFTLFCRILFLIEDFSLVLSGFGSYTWNRLFIQEVRVLRVALIQMKVEEKNRQLNIEHGLELLRQVAGKADVAVLPEVWTTGYSLGNLAKEAENFESDLVKELSDLAKTGKLTIVAGSMPFCRPDGKVYNTTLVYGKDGSILADYDKIHMFGLYNEEKYFKAGNKRSEFSLDGWSCGLSICYDLRFPELFRAMALNGVQIVYLPAQWPTVRGAAWRLLVQARAMESQIYVCAVNSVGMFKREPFFGHSMVVGPDGNIIAEAGDEDEIVYVDIQAESVAKVRSAMSVLTDVRRELYWS